MFEKYFQETLCFDENDGKTTTFDQETPAKSAYENLIQKGRFESKLSMKGGYGMTIAISTDFFSPKMEKRAQSRLLNA